jgi:sugar fermentation stimulation protein A
MKPDTQNKNKYQGLAWPPLISGQLIKRYKRFLADVELENGQVVTAHCPNSGSMTACSESGRQVYLSSHDNPKRKLKYTWEIIQMPGSWVGVNTLVPNKLVKDAIENEQVSELAGYDAIRSEVKTGKGSRLDLMLQRADNDACYIEVKNCTLVDNGVAMFPDAVTKRGRKHLLELERLKLGGNRCVMFFLIQRMDAEVFKPAAHVDPAYADTLRKVHLEGGVEILVYDVHIDLENIRLNRQIPYRL